MFYVCILSRVQVSVMLAVKDMKNSDMIFLTIVSTVVQT